MSTERRGPGAPPGGSVHWLAFELTGDFLRVYKIEYAPHKHNYRFTRYNKRTLIDEFLVVRTSKRCYRVIYYNVEVEYYRYFSARNYRECAQKMKELAAIFLRLEIAAKAKEAEAGGTEKPANQPQGGKGNYA